MKAREPFGTAAVRLGYATQNDISKVLEEQHARKSRGEHPGLIGTIMEEMGLITADQLGRVLKQLGENKFPLSEDAVRLAAHLRASLSGSNNTIVITGVAEDDGVNHVAAQLSVALALMEQAPVLLVDANLRAPVLHAMLGLKQMPGLSDLVEKKASLAEAVHATGIGSFSVLPAGNPARDSLSLLMSQECTSLMEELHRQFRFVIVYSSPILEFPETMLTAVRSDGVVLVLSAGERSKSDVLEIKRMLDGVRVNICGVVLSEKSASNSSKPGSAAKWQLRAS